MLEVLSVSVFYEVAALLVLASAVGMIGVLLRQPLIVSFIAVGVAVLLAIEIEKWLRMQIAGRRHPPSGSCSTSDENKPPPGWESC